MEAVVTKVIDPTSVVLKFKMDLNDSQQLNMKLQTVLSSINNSTASLKNSKKSLTVDHKPFEQLLLSPKFIPGNSCSNKKKDVYDN